MKDGFMDVLSYLPKELAQEVSGLRRRESIQEIRLRSNRPASVSMAGSNEALRYIPPAGELEEIFRKILEYSVHSFKREIANGYITLKGGNRAGFYGTAVTDGNRIETLRDIGGINFRIAREVIGCADEIMNGVFSKEIESALIVSPPSGGKTTILRDLCRHAGNSGRVSLIDERGEIAAVYRGVPQNDIGKFTDVLDGYPKAEGMMIAIRTLSPRYIFLDELGGEKEVGGVIEALFAGVKIIATAHASSKKELLSREGIKKLLGVGAFSRLIFLAGAEAPGKLLSIEEAGALD